MMVKKVIRIASFWGLSGTVFLVVSVSHLAGGKKMNSGCMNCRSQLEID